MSDKHIGSPTTFKANIGVWFAVAVFMMPPTLKAQGTAAVDGSNVRPPVTQADFQIVRRARKVLDSPAKWNRADNRECPAGAKTFSPYCALEEATEVSGTFAHRGAALQEARFVIDEMAADLNYDHRLVDYNNDPTATFADIQEVLRITESLIALRLKGGGSKAGGTTAQARRLSQTTLPVPPPTTKAEVGRWDAELVQRAAKL